MAEIPSDISSSAAQAGYQGRETGKAIGARRAGAANAADRFVKAVDDADTTVETTDNDTQVFADAEGTGSSGRELGEEQQEQLPDDTGEEDSGIIHGEDGQVHLDLEA